MGTDEFDKHRLAGVVHVNHQSIPISTDIEHHSAAFQDAGFADIHFDVMGVPPCRLDSLLVPGLQGLFSLPVFGFSQNSRNVLLAITLMTE